MIVFSIYITSEPILFILVYLFWLIYFKVYVYNFIVFFVGMFVVINNKVHKFCNIFGYILYLSSNDSFLNQP